MSPADWAIRPLKKYAVFSGRAPRAEYWWFYLGTLIVGFMTRLVDSGLGTQFVNLIVNLALIVPWLAVSVRRLHDTDRSGWWLAILVAPAAAVLAIGIGAAFGAPAVPGGFAPLTAMWVIVVIAFLMALVTLLIFMVTAGDGGPNSYGPDPYGPVHLEEVFA